MDNKEKIKKHVINMLNQSNTSMLVKLDSVLNSGAVDIDSWDENNAPMLLPKAIIIALLEIESLQYDAKGTGYEKQIKKQAKNIKYFI